MSDLFAAGRFARGMLLAGSALGGFNAAAAQNAGAPVGGSAPVPPPESSTGQQTAGTSGIEEIVVTAQKRAENLQSVPISIQAFGTRKLEELNVTRFEDYAKLIPSVTFQSISPGITNVYFRGVASGGDGNHSGPLPSVGVYLDEQPVTTIQGALDVHIYDIERIEALSGPQGTLYGASAEAGVLRIITNKPNLAKTEGGFDVEGDLFTGHGAGGKIEGFYNQPLTNNLAIRAVGYYEKDGGYISNPPATRVFPVSGIAQQTSPAQNDFNPVEKYGGRVALRWDLAPNWTLTPTVFAQETIAHGVFGYEPQFGDLKVQQFTQDRSRDRFYQAAATLNGKIGNFDLTYAGAYMEREVNSVSDYSDYSYFYDKLFGSGAFIADRNGNLINPAQTVIGHDRFSKMSHELRIASPKDNRLRGIAGLFYERQTHNISQLYNIQNFPADGQEVPGNYASVPGYPGDIWVTKQYRVDRDYAVFADGSFDLVRDKLILSGGIRGFLSRNTLDGYFGLGPATFGGSPGYSDCPRNPDGSFALPIVVPGAPCTNVYTTLANGKLVAGKLARDTGETHRVNLQWKITNENQIYATYSTGFRPGGINRRATLPPYQADFLDNYEIGTKNSFFNNHLRVNADVFYEYWNKFQFSFLGGNGLTEIYNGPNANIYGVESDFTVIPVEGLTLAGAIAYTDARLTSNYCGQIDANNNPITSCPGQELAFRNERLPVTPLFKSTLQLRYQRDLGPDMRGHIQLNWSHQSSSRADLRDAAAAILGLQQPYDTIDLALGGERGRLTFEVFVTNLADDRGDTYRYTECAVGTCGQDTYVVPVLPRRVGVRAGVRF